MRFARVFRNRRPVRWFLLVLTLVGVGSGLYVVLPPEPRWTLHDGPKENIYLTDDRLATCCILDGAVSGPVQRWDVATGREFDRFLTDGSALLWDGASSDGRWFVVVTGSAKPGIRHIRRIDLREGNESEVEVPLGKIEYPQLSGDCEFLAVGETQAAGAEVSFAIVDSVAARVLHRFQVPWEANKQQIQKPIRQDGVFTQDGSYFVITYVLDGVPCTRIVGTRTAKAAVLENAAALGLAPDSRSLIVDRGEVGVWIWDMPAMDWRCRLQGTPTEPMEFSADGRWIVCTRHENDEPLPVRFFDLKTGELHWELPVTNSFDAQFSPDSRYCVLRLQSGPTQLQLLMCDASGRKRLWEKDVDGGMDSPPLFTPDSRTLIASWTSEIAFIDVATGETRRTIELPGSVRLQTELSGDGRTLLVEQRSAPSRFSEWKEWLFGVNAMDEIGDQTSLHVYDVETGRELACLYRQRLADTMLTPDRQSLVTQRHQYPPGGGVPLNTVIQCWDLPPRTAWRWVLSVPLALGLLVLAFGAGWRRWQRRLRPVGDAASVAASIAKDPGLVPQGGPPCP